MLRVGEVDWKGRDACATAKRKGRRLAVALLVRNKTVSLQVGFP